MRRFVDLHVHSTASDGATAPAELVLLAERKRLAAVALTDHDTTAGLGEAAEAARDLPVRFVPGVEVSARFPGGTLHMLGLGIDAAAGPLRDLTRRLRESRNQRNPKMVTRLRALGIDVTMPELRRRAGGGLVGRMHMAMLLQEKGCVRSVDEAFASYLGPRGAAFVDKERAEAAEAIDAIHAAGGLAILAHPALLNCANTAQLRRVCLWLAHAGLDGIEAYHGDHTDAQTRTVLTLAGELGLLVSGGSDFHGPNKPQGRMGLPRAPLAAVEQLLAKLPA